MIARAADVLLALSNHPDGLSLREISQYVKLPRSTVQRIVNSLEEANLVIAASPTSGFRLGPTLTLLAEAVRPFDIARMARPLIVQLSTETGETVDLSILSHGKAVVVDQISGLHPLQAVSTIGTSLPLHGTSIGKSLLAALPEKDLDALRSQIQLKPLTKNTVVSWDQLSLELDMIRETGLAFDQEEYMIGISSVATVLRGPGGELAAVSLPVPTERYRTKEKQLVEALVTRTQNFQRRL
ncbi:IclR family transcriptional regulator [Holophaga foetida]|uniref:IclR family transcriptional regulator n=1 Tax=Holophaga foetida TaxID=35839 RepID=UPI0002473F58|nr:IclR family transcriptional regulator [Holophaga foetida]